MTSTSIQRTLFKFSVILLSENLSLISKLSLDLSQFENKSYLISRNYLFLDITFCIHDIPRITLRCINKGKIKLLD